MAFFTLKQEKKNTFEWQKCVPEVIFPWFRGGGGGGNLVYDFEFGGLGGILNITEL